MTVTVLIQNELFSAHYLVEIHAYGREIAILSPPLGHLSWPQAVSSLPVADGAPQLVGPPGLCFMVVNTAVGRMSYAAVQPNVRRLDGN